MKYGELNLGQVEAIVNKLGGIEGVQKFLRGEVTVSEPPRSWREQDGVIYFKVTSDGTTGPEWIERLKNNGLRVSNFAKSLLRSPDFKPTSGVTTEVAVLKGTLFGGNERITKRIRIEANRRKLTELNTEAACLIREKFTDWELEAMGLYWIIAMHEPIKDHHGSPSLLYVNRYDGGRSLEAAYGHTDRGWSSEGGFAFAVSQVSSES